eukprot:12851165-Prorocentrum_lima.AAC.1
MKLTKSLRPQSPAQGKSTCVTGAGSELDYALLPRRTVAPLKSIAVIPDASIRPHKPIQVTFEGSL